MEIIEITKRLNEFEEETYQRFTTTEPVRTNPRTAYLISSARDLHNQAIKLLNAITDAPSVKTLTQAYELEIMATRVLESAPETAVYQSYHLFPAALIALLMNNPQKALACSPKLINTSLPRALGKYVLDLTQYLAKGEIAVKAREACKRGIITNLPRKLQFLDVFKNRLFEASQLDIITAGFEITSLLLTQELWQLQHNIRILIGSRTQSRNRDSLAQAGEESGIKIEYDKNRSTEEQNVHYLHNADDKTESGALIGLIQAALNLEIPGDPPPKATVGVLARKWDLLYTLEAELLRSGIPYKFEGDTAIGLLANGKIKDIVVRASRLLERVSSDAEFGNTSEGQIGRDIRSEVITKADVLLKRVLDSMPGKAPEEIEKPDFDHLCEVLKDTDATILSAFNAEPDKTQLVLSTVHSQKGEECDTVIVLGMEDGNSPHEPPKAHKRLLEWRKLVQTYSRATWRKDLTDEDLESLYDQEEKRIFYVALTRARHNLILSRAQKRCRYNNSNRSYEKSCFLDLPHEPKCVTETYDGGQIHFNSDGAAKDASYRSDGRQFQTNSGQKVRSKSEMLLANEFTTRGIYFEYEEPDFGVPGALPDFIFPDYGNPVLEHLGMMEDNVYREKWDEKAKRYEAREILFLQTNEQNIRTLEQTIDNLHDQFISQAERRFGRDYWDMIALDERLRREPDITILLQVQSSPDLIYEIKTSPIGASLCCIPHPGELSRKPDLEIYSGTEIKWDSETINGIQILLGYT